MATDGPSGLAVMVETTASTDGAAYKQGVARQLRGVTPLGPGRNRTNLGKPTIDALGQLLGTDGIREWSPRDGRIVELGTHRTVNASIGHGVRLDVRAATHDAAE